MSKAQASGERAVITFLERNAEAAFQRVLARR
jgi:hypothetical protein